MTVEFVSCHLEDHFKICVAQMFFQVASVDVGRHLKVARRQNVHRVFLVRLRGLGLLRRRVLKVRKTLRVGATVAHVSVAHGWHGGGCEARSLGNATVGNVDTSERRVQCCSIRRDTARGCGGQCRGACLSVTRLGWRRYGSEAGRGEAGGGTGTRRRTDGWVVHGTGARTKSGRVTGRLRCGSPLS